MLNNLPEGRFLEIVKKEDYGHDRLGFGQEN
jgi:hypothetical protein